MNYNEKVKEHNTLLRIFDSTILGISLAVISFSVSSYSSKVNYSGLFLLYISWFLLVISFFTTILRFHHTIRVYGRNAMEQYEVEVHKKEPIINEARLKATNRKSAWLYKLMLSSFCTGILIYILFRVLNLN